VRAALSPAVRMRWFLHFPGFGFGNSASLVAQARQ
jgi:hypothetical protein